MFSCEHAVHTAYDGAQVSHRDIQFFGLYDCFPICLIRAIEAVGLAGKHRGGEYIERMYALSESQQGVLTPEQFPINTHGGLLAFGAPWEVLSHPPGLFCVYMPISFPHSHCHRFPPCTT